jgi:SH3-like domain-containing protein
LTRLGLALVLAAAAAPAAAEFRSLAEPAVLYDAPSTRAKRLYVASRGTPVDVITFDAGWAKVRDASGELTWVERKVLSEVRTVVVSAPVADVRTQPAENAPLAFQAQSGVILELVETGATGWVRVRHRDGGGGFARIGQLWGVQ